MSLDAAAFPQELQEKPASLIGFLGLEVDRSAVHRSVWEAFSGGRQPDRIAIRYKLLPENHEFPPSKPKRSSYEWYRPQGILKRNWMQKHLYEIPAVVVLFKELEWNDAQWLDKQNQCASEVQRLNIALAERNVRVCLLLIQRAAPLPPGEDMLASERASALTAACGLNSKMLFILPHNENLHGYAQRLESAFMDMAQAYYSLMAKRIRSHRDQLSPQQLDLRIRYQFKLGLTGELRQDLNLALNHYKQAYHNLEDVRMTDANCLELKVIAGFLNFKTCKLMFRLKAPREAVSYFQAHIEKYKPRIGFRVLEFEHHTWLCTQYTAFGDLLCEAVRSGNVSVKTQHPGTYYQKAAECAINRRRAAQIAAEQELGGQIMNEKYDRHMAANLHTDCYGARVLTTDPIAPGDSQAEMLAERAQAFAYICEQERHFAHSSLIIELLSQAMAQFKLHKCQRFRHKLAIDLADEYLRNGDKANALTLYTVILHDYRLKGWREVYSNILQKTLRCALLSGSVANFLSCSFEALSPKLHLEQKQRIILLENIWEVLQGMPPSVPGDSTADLYELWSDALINVQSPVGINLDNLSDIIELSASFQKKQLHIADHIYINLFIRVTTDIPLRLRNFSILFTDGTKTYRLKSTKYAAFDNLSSVSAHYHREEREGAVLSYYKTIEHDLQLEPSVYYSFVFNERAQQFAENTYIQLSRIEALMGTDKLSLLLTRNITPFNEPFLSYKATGDVSENINMNGLCYIAPTFHLTTNYDLRYEATMMTNEYYPIKVELRNTYDVNLQSVTLHISIPKELRNSVFLALDISSGRQKLHSQIQVEVGEISKQASSTAGYYVFSLTETTVLLYHKLSYTVEVETPACPAQVIVVGSTTSPTGSDLSPENTSTSAAIVKEFDKRKLADSAVSIEISEVSETRVRKTRNDTINLKCHSEFTFNGYLYTLNRKPLTHIYRGENFLLRAKAEITAKQNIEILDCYFICDHNLVRSNYSSKRKKFSKQYKSGDALEDIIVLRTNASQGDWTQSKAIEGSKSDDTSFCSSLNKSKQQIQYLISNKAPADDSGANNAFVNKSLMAKIPPSMTVVGHNSPASNVYRLTNMHPTYLNAEEMKESSVQNLGERPESTTPELQKHTNSTRVVFNKAMEAVQATAHSRGVIKGVYTADQKKQGRILGVYCIRWRRCHCKDENESKFVIAGLNVINPPLNIYCTIDEQIFVCVPMTFKVVLHNPTSKIIHLKTALCLHTQDEFVYSGHKQLDISIMAFDERDLVYNLYPIVAGWLSLPTLKVEYNTEIDPQKNASHNSLLQELVRRALPKRVFVLPPFKANAGTAPDI